MIKVNRVYRYPEDKMVHLSVKLRTEIVPCINDDFENA